MSKPVENSIILPALLDRDPCMSMRVPNMLQQHEHELKQYAGL